MAQNNESGRDAWTNLVSRVTNRNANESQDVAEEPLRDKRPKGVNRSKSTGSRWKDVRDRVSRNTADFFGVSEEGKMAKKEMWEMRRMRLLSRQYKVKKALVSQHSLAHSLPPTLQRMQSTSSSGEVPDQIDGEHIEVSDEIEEFELPKRLGALAITYKGLTKASSKLKKKISQKRTREETETPEVCQRVDRFETEQEPIRIQTCEMQRSSDVPDSVRPTTREVIETQVEVEALEASAPVVQTDSSTTQRHDQDRTEIDAYAQRFPELAEWYQQKSEPCRETTPSYREERDLALMTTVKPRETTPQSLIDYQESLINWMMNKDFRKNLSCDEKRILEHHDDERPFFTYWISIVQILILIITLVTYGLGKPGFGKEEKTGQVLVTSLSLQHVSYSEYRNFWFGPKPRDLIHLGAKFTPCMRNDKLVYEKINDERNQERETACCIRNDGGGCVQTKKEYCSPLLSSWFKWDNKSNLGALISNSKPSRSWKPKMHRTSGSVCGQDPRYCEQPASAEPFEWPDDITQWPVCRKPISGPTHADHIPHMNCELIGRPCCLGVHGQCVITTRDYCNFVHGFFHEEATLCSQVSCMEDVCGMLPFFNNDKPDQFYRIWTPIFIHAGILHLLFTLLFHWFIMRDIERMIGWVRMAIIYMGSGIAGYLASAIFVPYRAEVGPAGSIFGLLAFLIVEVINKWDLLEDPVHALMKQIFIAFFLFLLGLVPWVDNYAHLFGFFTGLLLSFIVSPYLDIHPEEQRKRVVQINICLTVVVFMLTILVLLLYVFPIYHCPWCKYLNCIPFNTDWCQDHEIKIPRTEIF